ncbi:hypothetical protein N181_19615 [Sinorhizobium fredii USDA 205]|nr:hypothetical protein N181_19615 [Sinorhizobium fredii USDA 205]
MITVSARCARVVIYSEPARKQQNFNARSSIISALFILLRRVAQSRESRTEFVTELIAK